MLYPINGATNVPDGNFTLVLAFSYGSSISLTPSNGGSAVTNITANAAVPTPLPSPAATPDPLHTPYGYGIPALQSGTPYTLVANFTSIDTSCAPSQFTIGSFTTR
jgi:hypothetical protein